MRIDGKQIADRILAGLAGDVASVKMHGIIPALAVLLAGDNPASLAYIRQKQKAAERIGAKIIFSHQPGSISKPQLRALVDGFNRDPDIHGLIIQRPIPREVGDIQDILNSVVAVKDVDGFLPNSPFDVPVALAVGEILKVMHGEWSKDHGIEREKGDFLTWLRTKNIVVVGRGETAGAPIVRYLENLECATSTIHTGTLSPEPILKKADIIISCVGKRRVVTKERIKPGSFLISVGIFRDETGALRGDYDEAEIASVADHYTPTPGGVGPVNVACLMQNLIKACSMNRGGIV